MHWHIKNVCVHFAASVCAGSPVDMHFANLTVTGSEFGSNATYQCLPDFLPTDPIVVQCIESTAITATWEEPTEFCYRKFIITPNT